MNFIDKWFLDRIIENAVKSNDSIKYLFRTIRNKYSEYYYEDNTPTINSNLSEQFSSEVPSCNHHYKIIKKEKRTETTHPQLNSYYWGQRTYDVYYMSYTLQCEHCGNLKFEKNYD